MIKTIFFCFIERISRWHFWHSWSWCRRCILIDILLSLLVDIFCCCYCWPCCHNKFLIKLSLIPLDRQKTVSTLPAAIFLNVCLRFTKIWFVDNFFGDNPERKFLTFYCLFFLSAQLLKYQDCVCSVLKSGVSFCRRGFCNGIKNDLF